MNRPIIFQFDDPILYLKEQFEFERLRDPALTVRRWALRMGLRSPKPLFTILQGKRELKLKDFEFLRKGLDLSPEEVRYFEALILWSKAVVEEKPILKTLLDLLKQQHAVLASVYREEAMTMSAVFESDDAELFSHWTDAALLSALRLKAVRSDLDLIRTHLLWEKDGTQIDRSMNKIRKQKLIADNNGDHLKPKYEKITTSNDRSHQGGRAYYSQVNQIAMLAIELPHEEREFQCFSIPARMIDAPAFKLMLRKFRDELATLSTEDGNTVFQFNLEMFPLLSPIGERQPTGQYKMAPKLGAAVAKTRSPNI
jgi:uncharacterized protein (TIGR02147 family)